MRAAGNIALLLLLALLLGAPPARADATRGVPLPPGARPAEEGIHVSPRGLRDTLTFYSRHLQRRAIDHQAIPLQRYRGIELARFLASDPASPWEAIHVYRHRGTTFIAIVGRSPLDPVNGAR
jgi:hypothetical protein